MTRYYVALTDKQANYYDGQLDDGNRDQGVLHKETAFSSVGVSLYQGKGDEAQTVYVVDSLAPGFDQFKEKLRRLKFTLGTNAAPHTDILNLQTAVLNPLQFSITIPASQSKTDWLKLVFGNDLTIEQGYFVNRSNSSAPYNKVTLTLDKNNPSEDQIKGLITFYQKIKFDQTGKKISGGEIIANHGIDLYNLLRFAADVKIQYESEAQAIQQQTAEAEEGFSLGQTLAGGFGLLSGLKEYTAGVMADPETSTIGYGTAWTGGAVTSLAQALLGFGGTLVGTVVAAVPGWQACNQDAANLWHGLTNFSFGLVGSVYAPFIALNQTYSGENDPRGYWVNLKEQESAWWDHAKMNVLGYDSSNTNSGDRYATSVGTVGALFVGGKYGEKMLTPIKAKVTQGMWAGVDRVVGIDRIFSPDFMTNAFSETLPPLSPEPAPAPPPSLSEPMPEVTRGSLAETQIEAQFFNEQLSIKKSDSPI